MYSLRAAECDARILREALERTADKRGSRKVLIIYPGIISEIRKSDILRGFWMKYQRDFDYAKDISFGESSGHLSQALLKTRENLPGILVYLESIGRVLEYRNLEELFLNRDIPPTPKAEF